jgi:hypothetical protein
MVDHLQTAIGGNDVDVIGRELLLSYHLCDGHARPGGQDARQLTTPLRIEMHHHHIGGAGIRRERPDKSLECLNSAGRCANRDNERLSWFSALAVTVVFLIHHRRPADPIM